MVSGAYQAKDSGGTNEQEANINLSEVDKMWKESATAKKK